MNNSIVENKEASLNKANEIASKLITFISTEMKSFECEDDPAEQIYVGVHTVGILIAKLCFSLNEYGKIYGIPKLTVKAVHEWVAEIAKENIKQNIKAGIYDK
jgi:hypothetical protein